jgi:hypothetical protein
MKLYDGAMRMFNEVVDELNEPLEPLAYEMPSGSTPISNPSATKYPTNEDTKIPVIASPVEPLTTGANLEKENPPPSSTLPLEAKVCVS